MLAILALAAALQQDSVEVPCPPPPPRAHRSIVKRVVPGFHRRPKPKQKMCYSGLKPLHPSMLGMDDWIRGMSIPELKPVTVTAVQDSIFQDSSKGVTGGFVRGASVVAVPAIFLAFLGGGHHHDRDYAPPVIAVPEEPPMTTPEPGTLALLGTGLGGLATALRFRRRSAH